MISIEIMSLVRKLYITPKSPEGDLKNVLIVRTFTFRGQGKKEICLQNTLFGVDKNFEY
jgi:hypothetical protein